MKMRRCEDEKMRYRPPLLEEPCAQTLSGTKEDVALRHRMSKRGAHVGQVKLQRLIDNLSTWAPDTDHTLSYVVFKDAPPGGFYRQQIFFSRLCLATCRKINPPKKVPNLWLL